MASLVWLKILLCPPHELCNNPFNFYAYLYWLLHRGFHYSLWLSCLYIKWILITLRKRSIPLSVAYNTLQDLAATNFSISKSCHFSLSSWLHLSGLYTALWACKAIPCLRTLCMQLSVSFLHCPILVYPQLFSPSFELRFKRYPL